MLVLQAAGVRLAVVAHLLTTVLHSTAEKVVVLLAAAAAAVPTTVMAVMAAKAVPQVRMSLLLGASAAVVVPQTVHGRTHFQAPAWVATAEATVVGMPLQPT
jgi:hypothetical protein